MSLIFFFAALVAYFLFLIRFAWQGIFWFRAAGHEPVYVLYPSRPRATACIGTVLDILFFRRIFISSKLLWIGSWLFHASLVLVAIRHMRFIIPSLPDCLIFLQPVGLVAGYLLPLSLVYLISLRRVQKRDRYTSSYNNVISVMLLLIGAVGLAMRIFIRPDLLSVKQFSLGIFGLSPQPLPDSMLFLLHIGLFLLLLPFLPTHIIAAPFVNLEANRRMEELKYVIHEK